MQTVKTNPEQAAIEAVRAHVAARVELLASCARSATALDNSATKWARAEQRAIEAGLTDRDGVQRAVCEKFPKITGNGKVSKTPNGKFRTSFDRFVLISTVLDGSNKTYSSAGCVAIARSFVDGEKLTLNDAVEQIKSLHSAEQREARGNETEAEKAAREAREQAETVETVAGIAANDGAILLALAARLDAMDDATAYAFREPIEKLMLAAERAIGNALTFERDNAEPVAKAA